MIQTIIDYFKNLVGWVESAFDFLLDLMLGFANMSHLLRDIANELPGYFTWFPSAVTSMIGVTLVIIVFYKFFGRT